MKHDVLIGLALTISINFEVFASDGRAMLRNVEGKATGKQVSLTVEYKRPEDARIFEDTWTLEVSDGNKIKLSLETWRNSQTKGERMFGKDIFVFPLDYSWNEINPPSIPSSQTYAPPPYNPQFQNSFGAVPYPYGVPPLPYNPFWQMMFQMQRLFLPPPPSISQPYYSAVPPSEATSSTSNPSEQISPPPPQISRSDSSNSLRSFDAQHTEQQEGKIGSLSLLPSSPPRSFSPPSSDTYFGSPSMGASADSHYYPIAQPGDSPIGTMTSPPLSGDNQLPTTPSIYTPLPASYLHPDDDSVHKKPLPQAKPKKRHHHKRKKKDEAPAVEEKEPAQEVEEEKKLTNEDSLRRLTALQAETIAQKDTELTGKDETIAELRQRISELEAENEEKDQQIAQQTQRIDRQSQQLKRTQNSLKNKKEETKQAQQEKAKTEDQLKKAQKKSQKLMEQNKHLQRGTIALNELRKVQDEDALKISAQLIRTKRQNESLRGQLEAERRRQADTSSSTPPPPPPPVPDVEKKDVKVDDQ